MRLPNAIHEEVLFSCLVLLPFEAVHSLTPANEDHFSFRHPVQSSGALWLKIQARAPREILVGERAEVHEPDDLPVGVRGLRQKPGRKPPLQD